LRAKAQLLTAAQQAGIPVNAVLIAKIKELAKGAGEAAENLAKAKVASDIKFGRETSLLTPDDAAIAAKLKSIYGDDVPRALNSTEAAALRMNNALKGASDSFQNSISEPLVDFETGAKTAGDAMRSFETQFVRSLLNMVNQALIVKPILSGIGGLLGLGGAASTVMVGSYAMPMFKADGGPISGPGGPRDDRIPIMASDGEYIVNAEATAKHRRLLDAINSGVVPGFASGGAVSGGGPSVPMFTGGTTIAPTIAVTVQGSPGMSNADHQKMGENIGKAAMAHVKELMAKELYNQRRPGGLLQKASR
jgi:hypothetical protein